ncbi:ClpXP protease specificity-enhancing factor [Xanthomonas phage RTH11]|nr:ClpXP protease specificity-enhancing factor [Xanthomonas phage RTH11]
MTDEAKITVPYDQFHITSFLYWIESNGYKPHLVVLTGYPGVRLPPASMSKEMEVINAHSDAVHKMQWHDDRVEFNARFGGKDHRLVIPYRAIRAVTFAHTSTGVAMPWANDPLPTPTSVLDPVFEQVGQALVGEPPQAEAVAEPEVVAEDAVPNKDAETEAPKSNVRTVDFRAPRKPKS